MKAVDFIRKFGWENSICIINEWGNFFDQFETDPPTSFIPAVEAFTNTEDALFVDYEAVSLIDLKPYVDAFTLVQAKGGLKKCLQFFPEDHMSGLLHKSTTLVEEVGV